MQPEMRPGRSRKKRNGTRSPREGLDGPKKVIPYRSQSVKRETHGPDVQKDAVQVQSAEGGSTIRTSREQNAERGSTNDVEFAFS